MVYYAVSVLPAQSIVGLATAQTHAYVAADAFAANSHWCRVRRQIPLPGAVCPAMVTLVPTCVSRGAAYNSCHVKHDGAWTYVVGRGFTERACSWSRSDWSHEPLCHLVRLALHSVTFGFREKPGAEVCTDPRCPLVTHSRCLSTSSILSVIGCQIVQSCYGIAGCWSGSFCRLRNWWRRHYSCGIGAGNTLCDFALLAAVQLMVRLPASAATCMSASVGVGPLAWLAALGTSRANPLRYTL